MSGADRNSEGAMDSHYEGMEGRTVSCQREYDSMAKCSLRGMGYMNGRAIVKTEVAAEEYPPHPAATSHFTTETGGPSWQSIAPQIFLTRVHTLLPLFSPSSRTHRLDNPSAARPYFTISDVTRRLQPALPEDTD
jgi:hypothetical protein